MADSAWRQDLSEIACNQKTGDTSKTVCMVYTPGNSAKFDEPPQYRGRHVSYRFILRGTTEGDYLAVTSD